MLERSSERPVHGARRVLALLLTAIGFVALLPVTSSTAASIDTQPPTAATQLQMTARTASSISLSWRAATDDVGVTSYEVWRGNASYGNWLRVGTVAGGTLAYTVGGLAPVTTYSFGIRAFDAAGNKSASSNVILASTTSSTTATAAPAPSPNLDATDPVSALTWRRSASFETDLNTGTDGWNLPPASQVAGFTISRTGEVGGASGTSAAKIVSTGGNTGCSCPRMKFEDGFKYTSGRDVWVRGSWYFPNPAALTWSRMMNLSSYTGGSSDYYTGLVIEDGAGQMLVRTRKYHSTTGQKLIFPARPIPVGRWFTVALHFKLSPTDGQALNEWYVDGQLVASNTVANMTNSQAVNVVQAGMPYFRNGINSTVYFDDPGLKD